MAGPKRTSQRSPLSDAALTLRELKAMQPGVVLLEIEYELAGKVMQVVRVHRVMYAGVGADRSDPKVRLSLVDGPTGTALEWPACTLGLIPDPKPRPNFPRAYIPGTAWMTRILVRGQDIHKPRPMVFL